MLEAISFLVEKDIVFKNLYQQYGNPYIPMRPEGFVTLCKLILEQQVSIDSGKACFLKIENLLVTVSPETISQSSDEDCQKYPIICKRYIYNKKTFT